MPKVQSFGLHAMIRTPVRVLFLVNGGEDSPVADRARAFRSQMPSKFQVSILYRGQNRFRAIITFIRHLIRESPRLTYVFDMGYSGVVAGVLYKGMANNKLIIDTGDAIHVLAKSMVEVRSEPR